MKACVKAILSTVGSHGGNGGNGGSADANGDADGLDLLGGGGGSGGGGGGSIAKALLQMQMPNTADVDDFGAKKGKNAPRLWLDIPGANIVRNLLQCPPVPPRQCKRVVESVLALDSGRGEMVALAKDSLGARCVVEPLIMLVDNSKGRGGTVSAVETASFEWARDRLHEMLVGTSGSTNGAGSHIGAVAAVGAGGYWCVVRLFDHGNLKQKTRIVQQLHEHQSKLVSSRVHSWSEKEKDEGGKVCGW